MNARDQEVYDACGTCPDCVYQKSLETRPKDAETAEVDK